MFKKLIIIGLSFLFLPVTVFALSTYIVPQGGTGQSSFPANSVLVTGNTSTSALVASSSPTVNYITATSTTATSTYYGNVWVKGNQQVDGNLFAPITFSDSGNATVGGTLTVSNINATSSLLTNYLMGNVGLGTTSPSQTLAVQGNSYVSGTSFFGGAITATSTLTVAGITNSGTLTNTNTGTSTWSGGLSLPGLLANNYIETKFINATSTTATSTFSGGFTAGNNAAFTVNQAAAANSFYMDGSGNVRMGISTLGANTKLEVAGNVDIGSQSAGEGFIQTNVSSAANPTYSFWARTDTGMFLPTTSQLGFSTGGSERVRIDNGGNVGIGTTSPLSKLAVSGGASVGADYNIAAPSNGMIIEGNVGIGTAAPGYLFHLKSPTTAVAKTIVSAFTNSTANQESLLMRLGTGVGDILSSYSGTAENVDLSFTPTKSDGTQNEAMRIQASTGFVGIGTTSPAQTLSVSGNGYITGILGVGLSVPSSSGKFEVSGRTYLASSDGYALGLSVNSSGTRIYQYMDTSGNMTFTDSTGYLAGHQLVTIQQAGNVGIGTTSPASLLHVSAGTNATTTVEFGAQDVTSKTCFNVRNTAGTATSFYFVGTLMIIEANRCR